MVTRTADRNGDHLKNRPRRKKKSQHLMYVLKFLFQVALNIKLFTIMLRFLLRGVFRIGSFLKSVSKREPLEAIFFKFPVNVSNGDFVTVPGIMLDTVPENVENRPLKRSRDMYDADPNTCLLRNSNRSIFW